MSIFSYLDNKPRPVTVLSGPFRGSRIILNPAYSKRKILGLYEHILNPWFKKILPKVEVAWDVGANDGYFTYGCAHAIKHYQKKGHLIAFEPLIDQQKELQIAAFWNEYQNINFEFIPLFVGNNCSDTTITLEQAYQERKSLQKKLSLIKVDVEGAEIEVLEGSKSLLKEPHHWVVEVHGDHLIQPVQNCFIKAGRKINIHELKPHWLLGSESRTIKTSWITTTLE